MNSLGKWETKTCICRARSSASESRGELMDMMTMNWGNKCYQRRTCVICFAFGGEGGGGRRREAQRVMCWMVIIVSGNKKIGSHTVSH